MQKFLRVLIIGLIFTHSSALTASTLKDQDSIIVAVIDTGIDSSHRHLSKPAIYGWNFVTNQANTADENGHGTHIAGIIQSVITSAMKSFPITHRISIMPLKYYAEGSIGKVNLEHSIKAIYYAIRHGARIINYSGGGPGFSQEEFLAIKEAQAHGILFVAAAGNEKQDIDQQENYYYPSAYRVHGLTNIISVAATDQQKKLLPSSNWGKKNVDIAALGDKVYSSLPHNRFGYMSGTSQATAYVTGVAALLLAQNPSLSPQKAKEIILKAVDPLPGLTSKVSSGGIVNPSKVLISATPQYSKN